MFTIRSHWLLFIFCLGAVNLLAAPILILDANAFDGNPFQQIDFEEASGQNNLGGVQSFVSSHGATFSLSAGDFTTSSSTATNSSLNGGFDGGAVSGVGHLRGSPITVAIDFSIPVDAVGLFMGGVVSDNGSFQVTLTDNSLLSFSLSDLTTTAGLLPKVDNSDQSANAINGFIGVDANDGLLIKRMLYTHTGDTHSIDDIFFGTANSVVAATANTNIGSFERTAFGPQFFQESLTPGSSSTPLPLEGNGVVPEPSSYVLFGLAIMSFLSWQKKN